MIWSRSLADVARFFVGEKKWVLLPVIVVLALVAIFILLAEVPALAPFIYAIF
ncbi:MAG: DUF5989 family protein [Deferrisomatales bacterium]|nr:DUF5989 family protein [Deferrisomatales bacterium]